MQAAGLGSKHASAYDKSFYWKGFPSRLHLIKTNNTTLSSSFYKIFAWTYFLSREIKTDIAQIGFCVLLKNLIVKYIIDVWLSVIWYLIKNGLIVLIKLRWSMLNITNHFINTIEL